MLRTTAAFNKRILHARQVSTSAALLKQVESAAGRKTAPLVRLSNQFKTFKPITPSLRHVRIPLTSVSTSGPFKPLTISKRKSGGRNSSGRVVSRHIGGGHKRRLRTLDFARLEGGVKRVVRVEYDPNRSAHIALLRSVSVGDERDDTWSYILAPKGIKAGDQVQSFRTLSDAGIAKLTAAASLGDFSGDALSRSEKDSNNGEWWYNCVFPYCLTTPRNTNNLTTLQGVQFRFGSAAHDHRASRQCASAASDSGGHADPLHRAARGRERVAMQECRVLRAGDSAE